MKLKSTILFLLVFFLAVGACKETETPIDDPVNKDPEPVNVPTTEISIAIPEGTSLDLTGMKVVANTFSFPVDGSGKSKVAFQSGLHQMAFLMDAQDRVILTGFINNVNKKLSVASTSEVLLYFRSGAFIMPYEFREKFITEISAVEGFDQLNEKLAVSFKQNPLNFSSGTYIPFLDEFLSEIIPDNEPLDIRARQINFEPNGERSGIRVMDNNFQSVILRNSYRRRAHAFIYKTSFKDKDGNETKLKSSFSGSDVADSQQAVNPSTALDGFLGTVAVNLAGQGAKYVFEDSPPINIPLASNESEAKYKVRVIGTSPGVSWLGREHTDAEKAKWEDLMIETLFLDMVIPLMSEAFAAAGNMATEEQGKKIAAAVKKVVDFTPFIKELSETKDLTKFVTDVMDYFISDKVNSEFQEVMADILAENAMKNSSWDVDLNKEYRTEMKKARFLKVLQFIDLAIKGADFLKMIGQISLSSPLEIFEVTAKDHDITLSPNEAWVTNFAAEDLTVNTQTVLGDGQAFLYKWSTTGKYGYLRDNLGNKGNEIENGQKTITYKAEIQASKLPDNATDIVTVTAYVKQGQNLTKIGEAQAIIAVKPARLEVKPKDVTLQGKQKIKLYVEWANGDPFYIADDPFDYKFEWSTPAIYGNFEGGVSTLTTTVPDITYQALDEEVEKASETIHVIAYLKPKDSEVWTKYDDIEGSVKIENDENVKILHIPLKLETVSSTGELYYGFTNYLVASFEKEERHEAYTIKFFGFKKQSPAEGRTYSWKADQAVPKAIDFSTAVTVPENYISVWVGNNGKSCLKGNPCPNDLAGILASFGGMVEVKIKLKPE